MTSWAWHHIGISNIDDSTNDLGWTHTQDIPLLGGQSLQRVIFRLGGGGQGTTLGAEFGLVPAFWVLGVAIDTASPAGLQRLYQLGHAAQLHAQPIQPTASADTPWNFQYSVPAFDIDIQPHLGIPAGNSGSFLRVTWGVGTDTAGIVHGVQYAASWLTQGQILYLISSQT